MCVQWGLKVWTPGKNLANPVLVPIANIGISVDVCLVKTAK